MGPQEVFLEMARDLLKSYPSLAEQTNEIELGYKLQAKAEEVMDAIDAREAQAG